MKIEELKPYLRQYVEMITEKSGNNRNQYVCPLCGSGTGRHKTGAFTVFEDNQWKCFSCGETGDITDLVQKYEHLTQSEAVKRIQELFFLDNFTFQHNRAPKRQIVPKKEPARKPITPPEEWQCAIMPIAERAANVIFENKGAAAREYLHSRGIDDQTIREQKIGYIPAIPDISDIWHIEHGFSYHIQNPVPEEKRKNRKREKIYIPYGITFPYVMNSNLFRLEVRRLPDQVKGDITKIAQVAEGQPVALFNGDAAACKDKHRDIIFTEGVIDALSINQTVGRFCNNEIMAVTFGSADYKADYSAFFEYYVMPRRILIGFDNDEPGKKNAEKLKEEITKARALVGIAGPDILFPKRPYKDWNEYLQKEPDSLFRFISDNFPI